MKNSGCLGVILFFAGWYLLGSLVMTCRSAIARECDDEPPYYSTDDDYFHKSECPYITEDNFGDEYDSKSDAISDGLTPCPHCFGD